MNQSLETPRTGPSRPAQAHPAALASGPSKSAAGDESGTPQDSTRQRLLEAALEVFAELGYEGASSREICRRAGANGAALNYHWGSKQALWTAVCDECNRRLLAVVAASVEQPLVPERVLEAVLGGLFDAFVQDARPARILTWASLQAGSLDFGATAGAFQGLVDLCVGYLRQLELEGLMGDIDYEMALNLLQGQFFFLFVDQPGHRRFFGKDLSDAAHAERSRAALLRAARLLLGVPDAPARRAAQGGQLSEAPPT